MEIEENTDLTNPKTWKKHNVPITTTCNSELWAMSKTNKINWKEALELGLKIILADLDVLPEYPECKLLKRMEKFKEALENGKGTQTE